MKRFDAALKAGPADLSALKGFLAARRDFLLRLLENPNLLEYEAFTNMLWAVLHLSEELARRGNLSALSDADRKHLWGDIARAYRILVVEWLTYLEHLKGHYPYLYSLAVRTNPFDPRARVELP